MVEIDPDYEDFYECRGPCNKAVRIMWLCTCHISISITISMLHM